MRLDHPIFTAPYKVTIELDKTDIPDNYRHWSAAKDLHEKLDGWKVFEFQEGKRTTLETGLVSDPFGFTDSPDCEWISSGINSKGPTSVALGRQGNLFLWGFMGDPSEMTESARHVFANTICYMKQFDGQRPLVRAQARSREWVPEFIALLPMIVDSMKKGRAADEGKDPTTAAVESYFGAEVVSEVGTDAEALAAWYQENVEFLHEVKSGQYRTYFAVDQDLARLGVSNRNPAFFTSLITRWKADPKDEVVSRLLERYVPDVRFASADELAAWFEQNRSQLFFTDCGGFRWLLNPKATTPSGTR